LASSRSRGDMEVGTRAQSASPSLRLGVKLIGDGLPGRRLRKASDRDTRAALKILARYDARSTTGGFQVPSPGGQIDGGVSFGQYRRITR